MSTIFKSIPVRRSPVPRKPNTSGFMAMLSRLSAASDDLKKARPRKRRS